MALGELAGSAAAGVAAAGAGTTSAAAAVSGPGPGSGAPPRVSHTGAAAGGATEEVLFVVEVSAPQMNFEGKDSSGRLLLAAVSGLVVGRRTRESAHSRWGRRLVTVALEQVQAHVAPTDIDVNAGVQWLPSDFATASTSNDASPDKE